MSRAFVREQDGSEAFEELPEKQISTHPNFVTPEGLAEINTEVARLTRAYAEAQSSGERAALNVAARDLRYWTARQSSAELVPPPADAREVRFGSKVSIRREDDRRQTFRIVGEDEADPAKGTLSYVSPLARALMGKAAGDAVSLGAAEIEIVAIT